MANGVRPVATYSPAASCTVVAAAPCALAFSTRNIVATSLADEPIKAGNVSPDEAIGYAPAIVVVGGVGFAAGV